MDWTRIGLSPPIPTEPTETARVFRRSTALAVSTGFIPGPLRRILGAASRCVHEPPPTRPSPTDPTAAGRSKKALWPRPGIDGILTRPTGSRSGRSDDDETAAGVLDPDRCPGCGGERPGAVGVHAAG